MQIRFILLPIAATFTLVLAYLSYTQLHFSENSISISARVLEMRTSLSRMKGGGVSLHLDYDVEGKHFDFWHTLTSIEPLPPKDAPYPMHCDKTNLNNCQGDFALPWITLGVYSFFCLIIWGMSIALWKKRINFQ